MLFPSRQSLSKRIARVWAERSFGLHQKFLLAYTGLVLGLIVSLLLIVESRQRASIIRQMEKRGVTIATQLAAVSTNSLLMYDFVALEQDAEKISRDQDVLYAIILDREGLVAVYSGHDEKQGTVLEDTVSQRAARARDMLIQRVRGHQGEVEYYDIAVPVFVSRSPDKWGTVRIGLSLHDMRAEIRQTRLRVLFLGVLGVGLSTVAAAFLARRISAPIRVLTERTIAVARGETFPDIQVRSRDEIAVLATNFNRMTSELRQHRMALEKTNRELDQKVQELSILANYNENILTSMTSGLFTLDLDGHFETFNAMAETITGLRGADVRGQHYQQVLTDNMQCVQIIAASHQHHTPLTAPRLDFCRPDGQYVPLELRTAMLQDRDGYTVGVLAIFENLSSIQALQSQLRRADRLAALGQMAAGIAHEIKNPLASIRIFAQLVSLKHLDNSFVEKFDRIVPRELDRVNGIIEELLELSRPARLHCVTMSVQPILQRVVEVYAERLQQQRIGCKTEFPPALPMVEADAEQLYRGFANIALNAIEAMPQGGELSIVCRPVPKALFDIVSPGYDETLTVPQDHASLGLDQYASDIEIVFRDTGQGIPAEQLETLFTPFYTTKPKGTGLGLALTHKIMEEHRGSIRITSQVGLGTRVTVMLPPSSKEFPHSVPMSE